ncbi:PAS domain S-box protein [Roseomonas aerophila]|uniref:histidine kinase n=1 Tax=Teichococcus aerophilus TaxID=1224513 RepID=A0ABR7RGA6_9PROT|nr:PAS domain S-box protein [Pseudoroseomonas aerophila]MBC9205413.1 PAS domain S-box protein [Pseudoroseomonas aerophila]
MTEPNPPASWTEEERLAALYRTGLLDTAPEQAYDDLVRLAAELIGVPMAGVHLVAEDRQWGKAEIGLGTRHIPRDIAFCPTAMLDAEGLVVPDASKDPRFADNPLVTGGPGIRFYAGVPLMSEGLPVGALCVIDTKPRAGLDERQRYALKALASQASSQIALRRALAERDRSDSLRRQTLNSAVELAIISTDLEGRVTGWNSGAQNILGWSEAEMLGQPANEFFTADDRQAGVPEAEMRQALQRDRANDERWHQRKDGSRFWASDEMMALRDERGAHVGYLRMLRDRTAEYEAEQALREAEASLQRAQVAGGVGVFSLDVRDNMLKVTAEFCRLHGLPPRDRIPAAEVECLVLHEDAFLVSSTAMSLSAGAPSDVEYRIRRAGDGAQRWLSRRAEIERDDSGRTLRVFGVVRDITDQRRTLDALTRSEERYRALFEAIDDGFCIIEFIDGPHGPMSDYVHVEANPGYERHTGIKDVVGKTLRDIAPAEADGWLELYGNVLRTGEAARFERHFIAAGRHIDVSAARIEPPSRRQVSVMFRDVTARRQAEADLRASEALARENVQRVQLALAAGAIVGTWLWDLPTDQFTVDEAFARAFGLDPAIGRTGLSLRQVVETVHPDDKPGLANAISEVIARGGAYAHQYRVRRADGNYYWIEANGRVDLAPDGTPLSFPGVLIDVEERRAVEAERDRAAAALRALNETLEQRVAERTADLMLAEEQLRQSQKMEAVGQLTGGLAHDFNNLLTGITGSLELLATRIAQGRYNDVDRYVLAAQGSARRAAALTHRLLAFSRQQTLDPRPTDTNRLVSGMEELVRRTVGPAIEVEVVAAAGLWPTLVDPNQLENALLNLCINARDAMPDGGRLTIETTNTWVDTRAARERDMAAGQYVAISVTDTGTGMPPEIVVKAFEPFFTTKPLGQGTGLGLSMIYGFARQSGGQVRIYSELGQGTTMRIYLPRHLGTADEPDAEPELSAAPRARAGETVLVVDDEPTVRMLVMEILEELGYAAIEAADGASGLAVLRSGARVDLLVTDVGLPGGMSGRQMADMARVSRPDLKVLFITGYAENAVVGNGHLEPGMHVVTKPFAMEALASRIQELITAG